MIDEFLNLNKIDRFQISSISITFKFLTSVPTYRETIDSFSNDRSVGIYKLSIQGKLSIPSTHGTSLLLTSDF
ncbi:MAG: hypothetical protein ACFBSE_11025, partial [Prochloraceae cyanobacterium]